MRRRQFLTVSGAAAGAGALHLAAGATAAGAAARRWVFRDGQWSLADAAATDPDAAPAARMKVGCQRWGSSPARMPFLLRCGVRHICASPAKAGPDGVWTVESLGAVRKGVEDLGMHVEAMYLGVPGTVLATGERRDRAIDQVCRKIARAGEAGIPALQYNLHMRPWKPRTGRVPGRGGSTYSEWDVTKAESSGRVKGADLAGLSADEVWGRITQFLERAVPVATQAKVRLACHPPDPPMPRDNPWKVVQVLDTVDGMKRFVETCESPYHGLLFCQGSFCEMCRNPAREILDVIRWFGERRKIFMVHFRNLKGGRGHFAETYPDNGDVDMARAIRVYRDVGFTGMLMPDHVPHHEDDPEGLQGFAFAYGYIKGLIASAYAAEA
jgi:mannonate dehydratase